MTEQQKVSELYEQLPPEKKAVFLMMIRMIGDRRMIDLLNKRMLA